MPVKSAIHSNFKFIREWVREPRRTAAIAPSGRVLARIMTEGLGPDSAPVLELGPGTGVFTKAILDRGIPEEQLTMIELNPTFAANLTQRFPKATLYQESATNLAERSYFATGAGAALSGLGLLNMPEAVVEAIISGVFQQLRPGASLTQFTYGPQCPVSDDMLERLGLVAQRVGGTWRNLPPASVYRIARHGE